MNTEKSMKYYQKLTVLFCLMFGFIGIQRVVIGVIMPLLMFLSPVMYRPSALPVKGMYLWFNPLADMIEVNRGPLLGDPMPSFLYWANGGILLAGGFLTLMLFNAKRNRLAFWV